MSTKASVTSLARAPLNWRSTAIWLGAVAALAGAVYWVFFSEPAPAWRVRWKVQRYLKRQSGQGDFKVDFRFPSKSAMAKAPPEATKPGEAAPAKGEASKKDFNTLRDEYLDLAKAVLLLEREALVRQEEVGRRQAQLAARERELSQAPTNATPARMSLLSSNVAAARQRVEAAQKEVEEKQKAAAAKEEQLPPLAADLWAFQRVWATQMEAAEATGTNELARAQAELAQQTRRKLSEAISYGEMYRLIGQELWVAGRLFTSANPAHRRVGLMIARQSVSDAQRVTEDSWLAARICEGYIWPHLDVAEEGNRRAPLSLENVVNDCADVFRRADEMPNIIRNYHLLLTASKSPQRADWARVQLAQAHEQMGEFSTALRYLKQVKATNDFNWALRRLPLLEQRAKGQ